MATYRREFERRGWHRPWPLRLVLVVLGVLVVFIGWLMWSFEQEEGGWEGTDLGHHMIEERPGRVAVFNEEGAIVFEGTSIEEADAWIDGQRNRDFTMPALVIAGGGLLVVAGIAPSPRQREEEVATAELTMT